MTDFFDRHKATLDAALAAAQSRGYWSPYPESMSPKIYGETATADGEAAFAALLGKSFDLPGHPGQAGGVGKEKSPHGLVLGITYPACTVEQLIDAATKAGTTWGRATPQQRTGICLEILDRLNKASFLLAHAVHHTTGQAFGMAFQAGGPHAQDRGLEAVAYAYAEMTRVPTVATWEKPQAKADPVRMEKHYRIIPRGIALTIGCATFPTWNGYPGLFASLVTGNPVIVKPHPGAILPLAISLRIARQVLAEAGFDPNVLLLAADEPGREITVQLATHPQTAIIDFTGSNAFGRWLRENARQALVYTEEAGVNSIVIADTDNFKGMVSNIAFSLSLYSGQMCTAPQNIYVPRHGITTDQGHLSFDAVAAGISGAVDKLLGDAARASAICGAIAAEATVKRVQDAAGLGRVVRASSPIPGQEAARTATPLILAVDAAKTDVHLEERFGPIAFVVACDDAADGIARASASASAKGAITASVYSRDPAIIEAATEAFAAAGVSLSLNLTGPIFVNQSAAFSDFHVTGANPAGNASLTDAAFVANRFRIAAVRWHI